MTPATVGSAGSGLPPAGAGLPSLVVERIDGHGAPEPVVAPNENVLEGFKKAMRRLTSTVCIIATSEGGEPAGMVATAVSALCADPPSILICVNHGASIYGPLMRVRRFSVSMLWASQDRLVPLFGGKLKGRERFAHGHWTEVGGLPHLLDGQGTLFCALDTSMTYGSHEVVIGRIEEARVADHIAPLLWQNGSTVVSRPCAL